MNVSMVKVMITSSFELFFMMLLIANKGAGQNECRETSCRKDGPPIRFPFRLKDSQPTHCGYPGFDLTCTSSNETVLELPNIRMKFVVIDIDYEQKDVQVYSQDEQKYVQVYSQDDCGFQKQNLKFLSVLMSPFQFLDFQTGSAIFNCSLSNRIYKSGSWESYHQIPCLSNHRYIFGVYSSEYISYNLLALVSCRKMFEISTVPPEIFVSGPNNPLSLTWSKPSCKHCEAKGKMCRLKKHSTEIDETECFKVSKKRTGHALMIAGIVCSSLVLIPVAIAIFHVYTRDKNERETQSRIKKILEDYKAFRPSRFTYGDIKKITNQFKEKLGEGAYGTVFKGKLSNEVLVAAKILNNSKGNGEEFINEVGTMGGIHHVNVVRLVGYCAEGFRRALVYEFLPNDSLDKYISPVAGGTNSSLSWETLEGIALGIAKGIEYLHQGCDQRILHFDIKPHNILLDRNFVPKISDFGLAKLCSKGQSLVSMSTARGTMGYIAPEVFSRNFGNVSYRSDIYSFGMLLLEMVGGRNNTNVTEENTEEIYYPEWIYNLLEEGEDLRIHIEEDGDAKIAKKLAIVGLWCIQWHPMGRPTMKIVIQMLEAGEELTMPPNPFASMGPSKTNHKKMPTRHMALELEAIAE